MNKQESYLDDSEIDSIADLTDGWFYRSFQVQVDSFHRIHILSL